MVFLRESTGESHGIGWCTGGREIIPEKKIIFIFLKIAFIFLGDTD